MFPVGYGTWPLGSNAYGEVSEKMAIEAVQFAFDSGIRLFDTANIYGDGHVERLLGNTLAKDSEILIVTKAGYKDEDSAAQDFSEMALIKSVEESLERLGISKIPVLLLHSPPRSVLESSEVYRNLRNLVAANLVNCLGVSLRSYRDLDLVLEKPDLEYIEVIFNLLDQRPIDSGFFEKTLKEDIKVIARLPLCMGFLTGKYSLNSKFGKTDRRSRWSQEQIQQWIYGVEKYKSLTNPARSLAQVALSFCLQTSGCTYVIPGMKNKAQVAENIGSIYAGSRLSEIEYLEIRKIWLENLRDTPPM